MQEQQRSIGADSARGFFSDLDELNHAVSGADLEVIQLQPGDLQVHALSFDVGEMSVDRGNANCRLRVRGRLDTKRYAVGVFHPGARAMFNGNSVDSSTFLFYKPGMDLDGHLREGYGWTSLIIPADWVESISLATRDFSVLTSRAGCRNLRPDPGSLQDLRAAIDAIIVSRFELEQNEGLAIALSLDVRDALGSVLSGSDTPHSKLD